MFVVGMEQDEIGYSAAMHSCVKARSASPCKRCPHRGGFRGLARTLLFDVQLLQGGNDPLMNPILAWFHSVWVFSVRYSFLPFSSIGDLLYFDVTQNDAFF